MWVVVSSLCIILVEYCVHSITQVLSALHLEQLELASPDSWGLGQIMALVLALAPVWEFCELLLRSLQGGYRADSYHQMVGAAHYRGLAKAAPRSEMRPSDCAVINRQARNNNHFRKALR